MNNESTLESMTSEERMRLRKQMADQAIKLAVSSRWDEAANLNRDYLRLFGDESDAYNRLGKALSELGQIRDARSAYARSLELEPNNTIARRNLDRLATMADTAAAGQLASQVDTRLFIEETGKAALATLQAVDVAAAALLDAGDLVELRVQGKAVNVHTKAGDYVGMVEPRIGLRLAGMMEAGNQYSAAIVSISGGEIKVMLRETFQHASQIGRVSFPQGRISDIRAYTRRNLLREDAEFLDEDDDDDDEETDGWTETDGDLDTQPDVDVEPEDEGFD